MTDEQLLRYSRQIMLPGLGYEGQRRLLGASVLIVGLGGLGSPVSMYLAAAGVGRLILADFDAVELSNLQRQILHTSDRLGLAKVDSARAALSALNPDVHIEGVNGCLSPENLPDIVANADVVVDGSDNFATRFAVNDACFAAGVPLISGAAIRAEGQVAAFTGRFGGPCYQCLYPRDAQSEETCSENGILAPLVGIIGSVQATEAIKLLAGLGEPLFGRLLVLDALAMAWRELRLAPDPSCPVCGPGSRYQSSRK